MFVVSSWFLFGALGGWKQGKQGLCSSPAAVRPIDVPNWAPGDDPRKSPVKSRSTVAHEAANLVAYCVIHWSVDKQVKLMDSSVFDYLASTELQERYIVNGTA